MTKKKKFRLSFDVVEAVYKEIDELADKLDIVSKAELIRKALNVIRFLEEEKENGSKIFIERKNGKTKELVMR